MYLQTLSEGSVAYACSGNFASGGGVSPRGALLRGQSIIEYVLIIAIIGLVIVFAGPSVAGAIRNQFNLVGNTVSNGTTGGVEGGASGGGSAGADSATVQAAIAKDAKDWTLDEQKAVAEDIAAKGEASPAYAKAKAAMDANTKWSIKLTNGKTFEYRIIGIDHDDLADGTGRAGLTFWATNSVGKYTFNYKNSSDGGWEQSVIRGEMNSGKIWNLMPSDFQSKVESVKKLTNNVGGGINGAVTATSDKLFLLSHSEIIAKIVDADWIKFTSFSWFGKEGPQYEAFIGKVTENFSNNPAITNGCDYWLRTIWPGSGVQFMRVRNGEPSKWGAEAWDPHPSYDICPAFCF